MDIRQLRYFISVATHGSFTKASEKLYIAQPALSRHMLMLEEELGVKLLVRTPRGVETTEAGRQFKEKAEYILSYMNELKGSMSQASTEPTGQLVVGLPPSMAPQLTPILIEEAAARYPKLKLRIMEGLSVFMADWLDQARIDLALLTDYGPIPGLDFDTVVDEELFFVGAPSLLSQHGSRIPTEAIEGYPLIITHGFKMLAESWFTGKDVEPNFVMELDSISILRDMLFRGQYCSVMPLGIVREDIAQGRLLALQFEQPRISRRLVTAVKASRARSVALTAMQALIKEEVLRLAQVPPKA